MARPARTSYSTAADGWDPALTYVAAPAPLELGSHPVNEGNEAANAGSGVAVADGAAGAVEPEVGAVVGSGIKTAPGGSTSPGH